MHETENTTAYAYDKNDSDISESNIKENTVLPTAFSNAQEFLPDTETNENPPISENKPPKAQIYNIISFTVRRILPVILAIFSVSIPTLTMLTWLKSSDLNINKAIRFMLGDFSGGMGNVIEADTSNQKYEPKIPQLETDSTDDTLSQNLNIPKEPSIITPPTLTNETPYSPDMEKILEMPRAVPPAEELYAEYGQDAPVVLIIHTHATEGFSDTSDKNYRTLDTDKNIVSIGKIIADILTKHGISTLHCTDLFDNPDFNMAYYNASKKIKEYISAYPSISYILDIHRDSIQNEDGTYYSPSVEAGKETAAQMMFVVGTDHGGSGHTGWRDNLALAARLNTAINADYPSLMRSINLRSASFNEQYTKGSLLIEIGACASSLEEAENSAEILSEYLVREILG